MSYNFLMLETLPAKELSVAEEVDRLVGMDSSYCPLWYDLKKISRNEKFRGRTTKTSPVIPRLIFVTSSFPNLPALIAIDGAAGFVLEASWDRPETVPGWQMDLFKAEVEKRRLWALKMAAKGIKEAKRPPKFKSFAEVQAFLAKSGEIVDPETGEITEIAA